MKLSKLAPNPSNPRTISDDKLKQLKKALAEFGSLDGFVYNRKTRQLCSGHQRQKLFDSAEIVISKKHAKPTKTGTVAQGFVEVNGERFPYREVYWNESKEKAAIIAANNNAGEWDLPVISEWVKQLSLDGFDMDLTMLDLEELKIFGSVEALQKEDVATKVSEHDRKGPTGADEDDIPEKTKERMRLGETYLLGSHKLMSGDCLKRLKVLKDSSVDSVVTDPPYGLAFMGKKWDYDVPSVEIWREVLRVLKPGGHLLSFGGTRTYHRMVVNIEDAGFEIRDQVMWLYGSGFPKSHNIAKSIDKQLGAEPTIIGKMKAPASTKRVTTMGRPEHSGSGWNEEPDLTVASTPEAKQWEGWGTALKPANEPICVARKPLEKGLTVAANVLKWGTGALNIDASRVGVSADDPNHRNPSVQWQNANDPSVTNFGSGGRPIENLDAQGRWPANLILDEEAAAALDEQSGEMGKSTGGNAFARNRKDSNTLGSFKEKPLGVKCGFGDSGGASRFFYVAKASKAGRGEGNDHPTVKPVSLMEYLIELVTPSKGVVLEPFCGSGSTLIACEKTGHKCIATELDPKYCDIILKRWEKYSGKKAMLQKTQLKKTEKQPRDSHA